MRHDSPPKSREQQERDKRDEARRRPRAQPQSDREDPQQQQQTAESPPPEQAPPQQPPTELNPQDPEAGSWGRLPAKLHQDANNAQNVDPPERFRELIERYRTRLADTDD